ncbi:MAG: TM2 domain-containing protein [Oxalobacter sp.]|nr:TM2 domain-containing protein [Oxalobacter sp.]
MKVIQIKGNTVYIGENSGSFQTLPLSAFNFKPAIGDEVEVYTNGRETIVSKKAKPYTAHQNQSSDAGYGTSYQLTTYIGPHLVNKAIYCVLAFFLGGLGIHKFYAGRTLKGILYLVFCWTGIPAIIALIECIIALCKPADANGNILA